MYAVVWDYIDTSEEKSKSKQEIYTLNNEARAIEFFKKVSRITGPDETMRLFRMEEIKT